MANKKVFVITSCKDPYHYNNRIIKDIAKILNYECYIAEENFPYDKKHLLERIYQYIQEADYVLIDYDTTNFNIGFEAGITFNLNLINKYISGNNKPNFYFLAPKYMFDEFKINSDIQTFSFLPYKNYEEYIEKIKSCFKEDIDELPQAKREEIKQYSKKGYIRKINDSNTETFRDFNSLFEKMELSSSQINLTSEGMELSNAHLPIYYKNFQPFSKYKLEIKLRIEEIAFGVALHIQQQIPKFFDNFFMFNISEDGNFLPHIFGSSIFNRKHNGYWPIRMKKYNHTFKNIKKGKFFELDIIVNENLIEIINNKNPNDNVKLDLLDFMNYSFPSKDPRGNNIELINDSEFKERLQKILDGLNRGSFGFRVDPYEKATIKFFRYTFL